MQPIMNALVADIAPRAIALQTAGTVLSLSSALLLMCDDLNVKELADFTPFAATVSVATAIFSAYGAVPLIAGALAARLLPNGDSAIRQCTQGLAAIFITRIALQQLNLGGIL